MKTYLLTPGPTATPETVLSVFARPMIHHRTAEFERVFENVRQNLKALFQTQQDVILLSSTGTGAMEAAISNLFSPEEGVIVINGGKFGERWTKISQAFGLTVFEIALSPGEAVDEKALESFVQNHPKAKAILFQASETSTGVRMPTQAICRIARQAGMITLCDAITGCGVFDLPMDEWGIDVMITGSQKALMIPPGLSMIALSEKAWQLSESSRLPHFYFNLKKERNSQRKNQTAWTPAISLILGLEESLKLIHQEGLSSVFKRHELLAHATRSAVKALGLEILAEKSPAASVTAVKVPPSLSSNGKRIPKHMREKYGVVIMGGQDELEGKIFRLSHLGYCDRFDVITGITALELTLNDLGYPVELGKGVGAAMRVLLEGTKA